MPEETIVFEEFELDSRSFELRRQGRLVKVERIPLQLLFLLAENRDRLVSREEILEAIWGKNQFLDADNSINTAIRKARQALKDDPENPRFLRTVSGKGYRFTAQVAEVPSTSSFRAAPNRGLVVSAEMAQLAPASRVRRSRARTIWAALALLAIIGTAVLVRSRVIAPAKTGKKKAMLVVLPFVNLSQVSGEDYLSDGLTEEISTQLGGLNPEHLGVIARTSSMQYKGAQKGAAQVAQELGVDYLLEGSVRRDKQRVRVTAQLIQASDQTHLWAADFDRDLGDVLRLESDLALAISTKTELSLSPSMRTRLTDAPALNPAAHDAYLQGLHDWDLRTQPAVERSIVEFQKSIALDPGYAPAYAALARAYSLAPVVGDATAMASMPKARETARRAVELDPLLASGHTTLGFVKAHFEFDWVGAEREYRKALELNPNDAYAHLFYSNSYLSPLGRHEEAIAEMQKAIALDPFSAPIQGFLGRTYVWARQYDKAKAQFQKCAQMFPGFAIDHERMAQLDALTGKFEDAIGEETQARLLSGENEKSVLQKEASLRRAFAADGARGYWKQVLALSTMKNKPPEMYNSAFGTAILFAHLGDKSKSLGLLEQAYDERSLAMTEIAIEPAFDSIADEVRFKDLLRKVGVR